MGKPNDKTGNEEYVRGRKAGVDNTYGAGRKGTAEKTVIPAHDSNDGGGEGGLKSAASSIYRAAVGNHGDKHGDKALTER
jgi:hypothetical protein